MDVWVNSEYLLQFVADKLPDYGTLVPKDVGVGT